MSLKYPVGLRVVDLEGEHGFIESWEFSPPIKPYFVRLDSGRAYRYYEDQIQPEAGFTIEQSLELTCRMLVEAFEIHKDAVTGNIEMTTGPDERDTQYYANNGNTYHTALDKLLRVVDDSKSG